MDQKPRRHRFQFRLRTLMIVVTAFCMVVGGYTVNERRLVNERRDYLNSNRIYSSSFRIPAYYAKGDKSKAPSDIRLLLGDKAQWEVFVDREASEETKRAVAALFPESDIRNWP